MNRRTLMKQAGLFGLGLPAAGMLLNAYGSDSSTATFQPVNASGPPETPSAAHSQAGHAVAQPVTELTITARDLAFEPETLSATTGQPVRLTFINEGAIEHDWYAEGMPVSDLTAVEQSPTFTQRMADLWSTASANGSPYAGAGPGEQMVVEFTPAEAGDYTFICAVPGHEAAGMVGTLIVE